MLRTLEEALAANPPPDGRTIAVCVPDATRPVDVGAALRALQPHLRGAVTVVVGLGLHRRMRPEERFERNRTGSIGSRVGPAVMRRRINERPESEADGQGVVSRRAR